MTFWVPVHTFKIACGTAGAFVDVTAKVLTDQGGVTRSYGRQSAFSDFSGGTFSFTLSNPDGLLTPDNTAVGATPLSEGMYVTWQTDTGSFGTAPSRLVSGKIAVGGGIQFIFVDPGVPASARLRITVSDMLIETGRHTPNSPLAGAMAMGSSYLYFPLNEPVGSVQATELTGNMSPLTAQLSFVSGAVIGPFGVAGPAALSGETQMQLVSGVSLRSTVTLPKPIPLPSGSLGALGLWATVNQLTGTGTGSGFVVDVGIGAASAGLSFVIDAGVLSVSGIANSNFYPIAAGVAAYFVSAYTYSGTTVTETIYKNGVALGSANFTLASPPTSIASLDLQVNGGFNNPATDSITIAHISYAPALIHEEYAGITTPANRLAAIDATTPEITLAALPANISTTSVGVAATSGQSVLDQLNDVARTTQGQLFCSTAGSGTAPVQTIGYRDRDRPATPSATWVTGVDYTGNPDFERDLSNTVGEVDVSSPAGSFPVTAADLKAKVFSANTTWSILCAYVMDAIAAAYDRLNRGRKNAVDIQSITVDNMGLLVSRAADLFSLALGDRERITALPSQLGYTNATRDGYLIGVTELWSSVSAAFTLYLENCPVVTTAVYGTNRYAAGGTMTVGAVNSSVTTFTLTSSDILSPLGTADLPYTMLVDSEQVTVTAVTGTGPWTATVTRAANGTTAAPHLAGALIDVYPLSYYGF